VPKIIDLSDVHVLPGPFVTPEGRFPEGGRLFLASLRMPSPLGDGLTLAFLVVKGKTPQVYQRTAWIIGYNFLNVESMARLFSSSAGGSNSVYADQLTLFAPSLLTKFKSSLTRLSSMPLATAWAEHVQRFER